MSKELENMLPEQINLVESCIDRKNGVIELTICVDVTLKTRNSHVQFKPSALWIKDAIGMLDRSLSPGIYLENKSTKVNVSSSLEKDDWVLNGTYVFEDKNPPVVKAKPTRKKAAVPAQKATPASKKATPVSKKPKAPSKQTKPTPGFSDMLKKRD